MRLPGRRRPTRMFTGRRTTVCTGRRWSPSPMHSTRTSSMRHLPKDERERRVREAAAVAGADGAVGEAAAFLTEIKVAYDEPLTGDQHHGRPARSVPAPVLRALPRANVASEGGPRWPSTSSSCTADPQNAAALIVRDGAADAASRSPAASRRGRSTASSRRREGSSASSPIPPMQRRSPTAR